MAQPGQFYKGFERGLGGLLGCELVKIKGVAPMLAPASAMILETAPLVVDREGGMFVFPEWRTDWVAIALRITEMIP